MIRTLVAGEASEILHFPENLCTGRASNSPMPIDDIVSGISISTTVIVNFLNNCPLNPF